MAPWIMRPEGYDTLYTTFVSRNKRKIAKAARKIAKAARLEQQKKQETPSDPTPPSEDSKVQPELPIFYTRRVPIHEETPSEKMVQDG
jgi:hypothetical protein